MEIPGVFSKLNLMFFKPPVVASIETRNAQAVIANPRVMFYDPNALNFPDAQGPVVRDGGGYVAYGLGSVAVNGQPIWDRGATDLTGPVRDFFRNMAEDNRVKHT